MTAKPGQAFVAGALSERPLASRNWDAQTNKLAEDFRLWLGRIDNYAAVDVLDDAVRQATDPHTIAWLAAIAERYGFKAPC